MSSKFYRRAEVDIGEEGQASLALTRSEDTSGTPSSIPAGDKSTTDRVLRPSASALVSEYAGKEKERRRDREEESPRG